MKRMLSLLSLMAMALAGCGPDYDHTDIDGVVHVLDNDVDYSHVKVAVGTVVVAHIASFDTQKHAMDVVIRSGDDRVLSVGQAVGDGQWAFMGLQPGTTTVDIQADGKSVLRLDAIVTAQPALP